MEHALLSKNVLQLQLVMREIMKHDGGNNYKMPHMSKNKLQAVDMIPLVIKLDSDSDSSSESSQNSTYDSP